MAETEGMRYGENCGSEEQFLSAPVTPTTPSTLRGYFDQEHEDEHHEKKSVLAKVKDRARKWRQMLAKKKPGSHEGESSPRSWGGNSDDEEDEEDDPEYHGAPMYESEMAPSAYKGHHAEPRSLHSNTEPRLQDLPNISNTASIKHRTGDEQSLHHVDAFKARSVSNIMENPPAFSAIRLETKVPIKGISTTQHIMANSPTISNRQHLEPTSHTSMHHIIANSPDEHQFEAKVRQKEAVDERLNPCIMTNNPLFSHEHGLESKSKHEESLKGSTINHEVPDVHFLQGNNPTHHKMANLPAIPDMGLLEANSKQSEESLRSQFSDVHDLEANPKHGSMIKKTSTSTHHASKTSANHDDQKNEASIHTIIATNPAISDKNHFEVNPKHKRVMENHYLEAGTKDKDVIKKKSSDHVIANRDLLVTDKGTDNKTLTETMSEMLTPAYAVVSDASHTIASKILCPTDGDERGSDPVKDLTDSVTEMLAPAYTAVSEASHKIASKIHGPTAGEEFANASPKGNKSQTGTTTGIITPSRTIASKIHGPTAREEIANANPKGNKTLTRTTTAIITPSRTIASKIRGPTVEDEMGAKLALDPLTTSKTMTETLSGMLAPAYTLVSDASHKITSKIQSPRREDEIGAKHAWDKGVSVKEYLKQKLEPGEEERALSHVITETMSPKKSSQGRADEIGVVEKVRGAVYSLLQKGGHKESSTTNSSPILPVSTNPHSVEVEDRGGRRLQAYAN